MRDKLDEAFAKFGCFWFALWAVLAVAWMGFVVWAVYTVVSWLVTK